MMGVGSRWVFAGKLYWLKVVVKKKINNNLSEMRKIKSRNKIKGRNRKLSGGFSGGGVYPFLE